MRVFAGLVTSGTRCRPQNLSLNRHCGRWAIQGKEGRSVLIAEVERCYWRCQNCERRFGVGIAIDRGAGVDEGDGDDFPAACDAVCIVAYILRRLPAAGEI